MNKFFKVVFNKSLGVFTAVAENASSAKKDTRSTGIKAESVKCSTGTTVKKLTLSSVALAVLTSLFGTNAIASTSADQYITVGYVSGSNITGDNNILGLESTKKIETVDKAHFTSVAETYLSNYRLIASSDYYSALGAMYSSELDKVYVNTLKEFAAEQGITLTNVVEIYEPIDVINGTDVSKWALTNRTIQNMLAELTAEEKMLWQTTLEAAKKPVTNYFFAKQREIEAYVTDKMQSDGLTEVEATRLYYQETGLDQQFLTYGPVNEIVPDKESIVNGNNVVAFGAGIEVDANNAIAIGTEATVAHDGSIALGAGSNATGANLENEAFLVGGTATSELNIANGNEGRRITGVAAGAEDADAVNVQQLKAVKAFADENAANLNTYKTSNDQAVAKVTSDLATTNETFNAYKDTNDQAVAKVAGDLNTANETFNTYKDTNDQAVAKVAGDVSKVSGDLATTNETFNAYKDTNDQAVAKVSEDLAKTNTDLTATTQALDIYKTENNKAVEDLNTGLTTTNEALNAYKTTNDQLVTALGTNIDTVEENLGNYITSNNEAIAQFKDETQANFTAVNTSITQTNQNLTSLEQLAVKYTSTDRKSIALGGEGGTVISNVAAGSADTDAVNVSQLNALKSELEGVVGSDVTQFNEQLETITTDLSTVKSGLETTNQNLTNLDSYAVKYASNENGTVNTGLINLAGANGTRITNVADAKDRGDAVNFGQLLDKETALKSQIQGLQNSLDSLGTKVTENQASLESTLTEAKEYADKVSGDALTDAKAHTDSEIAKVNDAIEAGDAATLTEAKKHTDAEVAKANTNTDSKIEDVYKAIEAGDAATLTEAKKHTDAEVAKANTNTDSKIEDVYKAIEAGDAATLTEAKKHTDAEVDKAKTHTNTEISLAKDEAKTGDAKTLVDANKYTDDAVSGLLTSAKDHTNTEVAKAKSEAKAGDEATLVKAKEHANELQAQTNVVIDQKAQQALEYSNMKAEELWAAFNSYTTNNVSEEYVESKVAETLKQANEYTDNRFAQIQDQMLKDKKSLRAGIAGAVAIANLAQATIPGKNHVAVGLGNHEGESSIAVGVSGLSDDGKYTIKGAFAADTQNGTSTAISVGFHF